MEGHGLPLGDYEHISHTRQGQMNVEGTPINFPVTTRYIDSEVPYQVAARPLTTSTSFSALSIDLTDPSLIVPILRC